MMGHYKIIMYHNGGFLTSLFLLKYADLQKMDIPKGPSSCVEFRF